MPEFRMNWDALSAAEIEAILTDPSHPHFIKTTPFLDCHQWVPLAMKPSWNASGGFLKAQMRCIHPTGQAPPIHFWQIEQASLPPHLRTTRGLSHHLRREFAPYCIGDVIQSASHIVLAALAEVASGLRELGGTELGEPPVVQQVVKRATVASLRLDAACASIFHVSREEAQTAIEYGFMFVNFQETTKRSASITGGDILVFRNKGNAEIVGGELNPRSKRYWLDYKVNLI